MTIIKGILLALLWLSGWILAIYGMNIAFPHDQNPSSVCAWYGDIHIGVEPPPPPEHSPNKGKK